MEDESDFGEVVVTGKRQVEDSSGGDWAWALFHSTSDGAGSDSFDFGGSGGGPSTTPEEPPAEEEGEEVIVTAPEQVTEEAFETAQELREWAENNIGGAYRITVEGDTVTIEVYDVLSGLHGTYFQSSEGHFSTTEPFDVESYQPDPSFTPTPNYGPPDPEVWF